MLTKADLAQSFSSTWSQRPALIEGRAYEVL